MCRQHRLSEPAAWAGRGAEAGGPAFPGRAGQARPLSCAEPLLSAVSGCGLERWGPEQPTPRERPDAGAAPPGRLGAPSWLRFLPFAGDTAGQVTAVSNRVPDTTGLGGGSAAAGPPAWGAVSRRAARRLPAPSVGSVFQVRLWR